MTSSQLGMLPSMAESPAVGSVVVSSEPGAPSNPAPAFPLAELAPYAARGYQWNPAGQNLLGAAFPFSIVQLDENTTSEAQSRAAWNEEQVIAVL